MRPASAGRPTPGYWINETSGLLRPVIEKYVFCKPMNEEEIGIMREYLEQWIEGPWNENYPQGLVLEELRKTVKYLSTIRQINSWIDLALTVDIDPL